MIEEESDLYLVEKIKGENDEKSLHKLIERHSGIYVDMIKRFGGKSLSYTQINDMMDDKDYQIYKAALEYNSDLSKFSTFLALKTKYVCLTNKTNNQKNTNIVNFDDIEFNQEYLGDNPSEESSKKEFYKKMSSLVKSHPDPRVQTLFQERYFSSKNFKLKPWKEVCKSINLSIQGCINLHDKAIKDFQKNIKNDQITF